MMKKIVIQNRKIKIALVGCGRISMSHFQAIQHFSNDLELVAVCDVNPVRLENFKSKDLPIFTSLEELLKHCETDVVVLCTPSGLHAEQACLAAHYHRHVITEKPMATRWKDGLKMVKACDKSGVYLFVV